MDIEDVKAKIRTRLIEYKLHFNHLTVIMCPLRDLEGATCYDVYHVDINLEDVVHSMFWFDNEDGSIIAVR